jgi:hypothetical protein
MIAGLFIIAGLCIPSCELSTPLVDDAGSVVAEIHVRPEGATMEIGEAGHARIYFHSQAEDSGDSFVAQLGPLTLAFDYARCRDGSRWITDLEGGYPITFTCERVETPREAALIALRNEVGDALLIVRGQGDYASPQDNWSVFSSDGNFLGLWLPAGSGVSRRGEVGELWRVPGTGVPANRIAFVLTGRCQD